MTKEEFEAYVNDPLFRRLWAISEDVHSGRADAGTVAAFNDLRDTIIRTLKTADRALARYEPERREAILRRWIEEFVAEQTAGEPTVH